MSSHRWAIATVISALVLDAVMGLLYARFQHLPLWHGMYCALANAVTLGGDVSPTNAGSYVVNTVECFTIVPLFAASLSFFTSGLAGAQVRDSERRIKQHVTEQSGTPEC